MYWYYNIIFFCICICKFPEADWKTGVYVVIANVSFQYKKKNLPRECQVIYLVTSLDRSAVHSRADIQRQTTTHAHIDTHGQFRATD